MTSPSRSIPTEAVILREDAPENDGGAPGAVAPAPGPAGTPAAPSLPPPPSYDAAIAMGCFGEGTGRPPVRELAGPTPGRLPPLLRTPTEEEERMRSLLEDARRAKRRTKKGGANAANDEQYRVPPIQYRGRSYHLSPCYPCCEIGGALETAGGEGNGRTGADAESQSSSELGGNRSASLVDTAHNIVASDSIKSEMERILKLH